jgi:uncharacterized protein (TIGR03437 family)
VVVTQPTYSPSPPTQSFTATGGSGSVAVTAQGGCTWTATSNAGFITITSGSSGAGNGAVNFSSPLFFVAPGQVNYLMPAGAATGRATVTITSGNGKASLGAAEVVAIAPGLFAANANGQGVAAAVALRVRGGAQTFEPASRFDAATGRFVPAPIDLGPEGDQIILLLFGTGIRGRSGLSVVTCTIGGVAVPVSFAAAAPGFAGLDQVNVGPLPRSLAGRGEVDVVLTVDRKEANRVRIAIK